MGRIKEAVFLGLIATSTLTTVVMEVGLANSSSHIQDIDKKASSGLLNPAQKLKCFTDERLSFAVKPVGRFLIADSKPTPLRTALSQGLDAPKPVGKTLPEYPRSIQRDALEEPLEDIFNYVNSKDFRAMAQAKAAVGEQFRFVEYDEPLVGEVNLEPNQSLPINGLPDVNIPGFNDSDSLPGEKPLYFKSQIQIFRAGKLRESWLVQPLLDRNGHFETLGFAPMARLQDKDSCGFSNPRVVEYIKTNPEQLHTTSKKVFDYDPFVEYNIIDHNVPIPKNLVDLANDKEFRDSALKNIETGDQVLLTSYKSVNHGEYIQSGQNIYWDKEVTIVMKDGKIDRNAITSDGKFHSLNNPITNDDLIATDDSADLDEVVVYDPTKTYKAREIPFALPHLPQDHTNVDPLDLNGYRLLRLITDHELWSSLMEMWGEGDEVQMVVESNEGTLEVTSSNSVLTTVAPGRRLTSMDPLDKGTQLSYTYRLLAKNNGEVVNSWVILGDYGYVSSIEAPVETPTPDGYIRISPVKLLHSSDISAQTVYDITPTGINKTS